ncbi:unnamed protein product [Anisakis simplex]|uniref:FIP-RBD domain-containing protein n=1 Tax=Anisakis simplex TaxID=6269 RepID=A0A0M3IZF0_ANISI|nr:unnamed protein product [Anisakis simplex]
MEKMLNEMQIELARHEEKEKSLNEYIETLLTRIMDQNPNLLEAVTLATRKQSQRKRTTMP